MIVILVRGACPSCCGVLHSVVYISYEQSKEKRKKVKKLPKSNQTTTTGINEIEILGVI